MRNAKPGLFFSRIVNKAVYAATGARNIISRNCKDLGSSLKLECDGQVAAVPDDTESIIVLNINSYAGGAKLWTAGQDAPSGAPGATRCVFYPKLDHVDCNTVRNIVHRAQLATAHQKL
jgi:Diacylglycerol kinase accessory domain